MRFEATEAWEFYYRAVPFSHSKKKAYLKEKNRLKRLAREEEQDGEPDILPSILDAQQQLPRPIDPLALEVDPSAMAAAHDISMPKRPPWTYDEDPKVLEERETSYFADWLASADERNPGFFERDLQTWRQLWRVLEMSDVVVTLADARHPLFHFPPSLYQYVVKEMGKPLVLVLSKIDLIPADALESWRSFFRDRYPEVRLAGFSAPPREQAPQPGEEPASPAAVPMVSHGASKKRARPRGVGDVVAAVKGAVEVTGKAPDWAEVDALVKKIESEGLEERGKRQSAARKSGRRATTREGVELLTSHTESSENSEGDLHDEDNGMDASPHAGTASGGAPHGADVQDAAAVTIGLVGQPNVGKSSLLNALLGRTRVSVSKTPGRTKHFQTHLLGRSVRLCDSPGVVFPSLLADELGSVLGVRKVAQVAEPWAAVGRLGALVELEAALRLRPESLYENEGMVPPDFAWTAWNVCEAFAVQRGFRSARSAYPDVYRSANMILRLAAEGRIPLVFRPKGY